MTVYNIKNMEVIGNFTGTNPGDYFGQSLSVIEVYESVHNIVFAMTNSSTSGDAYFFEVIIDVTSDASTHYVG